MRRLPPLGTLPYFEAAGRNGSFTKAAEELCRTPTAISGRIRALEYALGFPLFERHARGVHLSRRGEAYLTDVQRILRELENVTDRHRGNENARELRVVAVEVLAEKWLMPKLVHFRKKHPEINIKLETDHNAVDQGRRQFDVWIAFAREVDANLHAKTLFEESLVPVCSPGFLSEWGRPRAPADLLSLPLLYEFTSHECWSLWFANHGMPAPDLSQASGYRLYSTVVQAAVSGIGVALGFTRMIEPELERGILVRALDSQVAAPGRYLLVTPPDSTNRADTQSFLSWILEEDK